MLLGYIVQGMTLGLSAAAAPGPLQSYLITQSLKNGWKHTLPAALAPVMSDAPIIALVVIILTQLPNSFLQVIQIVGGFYLLYLAWSGYTAYRDFDYTDIGEEKDIRSVWKAALVNLLNPNPYIFWSLIGGPIVIQAWQLSSGLGASFMLAFYVVMTAASGLLIFVFGTARHLGPRVTRILIGIQALALLGFGFYQLWQGLSLLIK